MNINKEKKRYQSDAITAEQVKNQIKKVNDYWQSNHPVHANAFWHPAAYHTGNIAAYDVTGVEAYKKYMFALLGKPGFEKEKEEYILDDNKINYLLKVAPIVKFKEDLELMNDTQIETLFDVAVEEKLTDYSKCQELKKLTGKDVLKQVQLASDDEE